MSSGSRRFICGLLLFFAGPFVLLEPVVRLGHKNLLQRLEDRVSTGPVDLILAGSSRVAAAIDSATLSAELSRTYQRVIAVENIGRGYSTPHDKYFIFRRLFAKSPENLKGAWLLIEAPQGLPDLATWSSPWAIPQEPGLLATVISLADWIQMARQSAMSPALIGEIGLYRFSRSALMLRKFRDQVSVQAQNWRPDWMNESRGASPAPELTRAGGVLPAAAAVQLARSSVEAPHSLKTSTESFDASVWAEVVELARKHEMRVAFFEPPMSSTDAKATSAGRSREQQDIAFAKHGLRVLRTPEGLFSDSEYPDFLHLIPERAPEFSKVLAQSFSKEFADAF
jgi:hypothetical protein